MGFLSYDQAKGYMISSFTKYPNLEVGVAHCMLSIVGMFSNAKFLRHSPKGRWFSGSFNVSMRSLNFFCIECSDWRAQNIENMFYPAERPGQYP